MMSRLGRDTFPLHKCPCMRGQAGPDAWGSPLLCDSPSVSLSRLLWVGHPASIQRILKSSPSGPSPSEHARCSLGVFL